MTLNTEHLSLRPCVPAHLLLLIEEPERFEQATGCHAAPGLRELFVSADVSLGWLAALRMSQQPDPWRHGFFLVDHAAGAVIGCAGFKGPPSAAGTVEYGIARNYEGRGYATEPAAALVTFALATPEVAVVCAHTLSAANASTSVLRKCGFVRVGTVVDPDDGPVWRWERAR